MKSFKPVSNITFSAQIYNQIYDAIISGTYQTGEKLPSEKDVCTMFRVSRSPVRVALSTLERNGFVNAVQGAGNFVGQLH